MKRAFCRCLKLTMPFYAVRCGRKPGVYTTWSKCESLVKGFPKARYKKFSTENEAWEFVHRRDTTSSDRKKLTETVASTSKSTADSVPIQPLQSDLASSSGKTRKRKAILLPDDYHSKSSARKLEEGSAAVYTDGCCRRNGKGNSRAGIGVYWGSGHPNNLSERLIGRQTNNHAEIYAAIRAVQQAKAADITQLTIYTDSQFLINCVTEWIPKWKTNGWKLANGGSVINREELEELEDNSSGLQITYVHVDGHSGIAGNEAADKLANEGALKDLH